MAALLDPAELDHRQATANLSVEGLSITHFDKNLKTWEINFLRNSQHKLRLEVRGNSVSAQPIEIDPSVQSIRISTVKGIAPDFEQFPNGYWFSNETFNRRTDQGHVEDFRWVVDFANRREFPLHALVLREDDLGGAIDSITKLNVANVIFFTRQKTWYPLTQAIFDIPSIFPFGKTNTMIGADIFCEEDGQVVIEIDAEEYARLPHVSGSPYQIEFENSDSKRFPAPVINQKFISGDFDLYYQFLNVIGVQYDMLCPKAVYKSGDCECNPGFVSHFD